MICSLKCEIADIKTSQFYGWKVMGQMIRGETAADTDDCMENIIKSHLKIIVLSMLSERPMCGYELIKEIFSRFGVFISQGTIYPLLYSLKEEGILQIEFTKGDLRTKRYSVTEEGRMISEKKIAEFVKKDEYILNSIKNGLSYV